MIGTSNVGEKWISVLKNKLSTCLVEEHLNIGSNNNVILAFKEAENFNVCKREATEFAKENSEVKYFFWSSNLNPLGKPKTSNCYVFKDCAEKSRTSLKYPGDTYQLIEGNMYFHPGGASVLPIFLEIVGWIILE